MKKYYHTFLFVGLLVIVILTAGYLLYGKSESSKSESKNNVFDDNFSGNSVLEETENAEISSNKKWWLNSGGEFIISSDMAETLLGKLPLGSKWQKLYNESNPADTDHGKLPQNLFRLVTKSSWKNFQQEIHFQITNYNLTNSPNRNESNGVLLFNRYQDGDNLYYCGLRVDGYAVIKKKYKGEYFTMAESKVFDGTYNKTSTPNLLPVGRWLGLRDEVISESNGIVNIAVYFDDGSGTGWRQVLGASDSPGQFGEQPILKAGSGGIRTDFMDVQFKDYRIEEIDSLRR